MGRRGSCFDIGREGESLAAEFLMARGYRIQARNFRFRVGEIDMVAEEGGDLVFVEVKTRTGRSFGTAAEAITPRKQQQLLRLAGLYLAAHGEGERPCRFDVVTVELAVTGEWVCTVIKDAFGAG